MFDDFIQLVDFSKRDEDHYLFTKLAQDGSPIFLIIYVDDMLLSGRHTKELVELRLKFSMKDPWSRSTLGQVCFDLAPH